MNASNICEADGCMDYTLLQVHTVKSGPTKSPRIPVSIAFQRELQGATTISADFCVIMVMTHMCGAPCAANKFFLTKRRTLRFVLAELSLNAS